MDENNNRNGNSQESDENLQRLHFIFIFSRSAAMAPMYQPMIFALVVEKPLQDVSTVVVFSLGSVVGPGDPNRQQDILYNQ